MKCVYPLRAEFQRRYIGCESALSENVKKLAKKVLEVIVADDKDI